MALSQQGRLCPEPNVTTQDGTTGAVAEAKRVTMRKVSDCCKVLESQSPPSDAQEVMVASANSQGGSGGFFCRQKRPSSEQPGCDKGDRGKGEHGCEHYRRRCKLVAPCCSETFWCRHCHNQLKQVDEQDPQRRHEIQRGSVREVVCALCSLRQPVATTCTGCGTSFGAYSCMHCCFFDDDTSKKQFHCDACGICRVGGRENFFHCFTCGCCYAVSLQGNHTCVEDSMKQNCPVCFEYLFDSVRPTAVLPCGHTIHSDCLKDMERAHQMTCPICMKSYADLRHLWQRLDEEIAHMPMPEDYAAWRVGILCNDCNQPSQVPFHILGLKCQHCMSYNTRRTTLDRGAPPAAAR